MNFDKYCLEANEFMCKVSNELENGGDTDHSYRVVRCVFHTLRDIITIEESLHFIAKLPMYLKAIYVHDWNLQPKKKISNMEDFLECLRSKDYEPVVRDFDIDEIAKSHVKSVFKVLFDYVSIREMTHIMNQLPNESPNLTSLTLYD